MRVGQGFINLIGRDGHVIPFFTRYFMGHFEKGVYIT